MPTISATIEIMDQASRSFQRMTDQVTETTKRMEQLKRIVESPFQLKVDAAAAETTLRHVLSTLGTQSRTIDVVFDSQDVIQSLSRIQSVISSRLLDTTLQVTFNTVDILQRAQVIREQIETKFRDIRANIELEMPAGLRTMFLSLQRMVARLIQAIDRLNTRIHTDSTNAAQLTAALERIARLERQIVDLQGQHNRQIVAAGNSTRSWWDQLQNVASAYYLIQGALQGIRSLTDVADSYINTRARLDLVNDGLQTTAELQEKIFQSAERARGSYTDMAAVIGRMGTLAGDAFKSNEELIAFTELMQKSFRVGGSGTMEQQAGMYQLSQAMAAGKLQGDEFRSIMENAPMLAAAIADVTGKTKGQLKEMSADGTITADIIKAAMFNAADDINKKFATMPRTFGDIMNELQNSALQTFGPLIQRINDMLNSPGGSAFIENFKLGIADAAAMADDLLTALINIYNFMSSSWPLLEPIILGIVTALGLYKGAVMAISIWTGITSAAELISASIKATLTGATLAATSATAAQTAAQWGLNAALLANPISWVILGIVALISLFYLVIAAINKFAGTSLSATGMIAGAFTTVGAVIGNVFLGLLQLVFGVIEFFFDIWNSFANFFGNLFNDPVAAVINLFSDMADTVLGVLEKIAKAMDTIFGTKGAAAVSNWRSGLADMTRNAVKTYGNGTYADKAESIDIESIVGELGRFNYGDAYKTGYDWGASLFDGGNEGAAANKAAQSASDSFTKLPTGAATTAKNIANDKKGKDKKIKAVGEIEKPVDISKEDLKILRDVAEIKNIQNFVSLTPTVQVKTGPVTNSANVDSIVTKITEKLNESIASSAQGVYS